MTTLLEAIRTGDVALVRTLVANAPSLLAAPTEFGVSPLLTAIYVGQGEVAQAIAELAPPSFFEACALGDLASVTRHLAESPKLIGEFSSDGFTGLGYAAFFGHSQITQFLLQEGAQPNMRSRNALGVMPLHSALAGGHLEIARDLLAGGSDPMAAGGEGWTPLHYAAHLGNEVLVKELLDLGADRNCKNSAGDTPANIARAEGHEQLSAMLEG